MDAATLHPSIKLVFNAQNPLSSRSFNARLLIPDLIGSSCFETVSEDACKDEDNARWVLELENPVREEWIQRLRWIRLIDRLAENELIEPEKTSFHQFQASWNTLLNKGQLNQNVAHYSILNQLKSRWFSENGSPLDIVSINAWNQYVSAIDRYHKPDLNIETFEQYEQMLMDLAGSFFQILPFLPKQYQQAAGHFGVVDQFYNHLRDLHEDIKQGICYLPTELLQHFGISKNELLEQRVLQNPNYYKMMSFWLDEYLPRLRRKVRPLVTAQDLHYSWKILCFWSLHRYRRIEQVFRECHFDYQHFPNIYWEQVRTDIPLLLAQVKQTHPFDEVAWPYSQLKGWKKIIFIHQAKLRSRLSIAN